MTIIKLAWATYYYASVRFAANLALGAFCVCEGASILPALCDDQRFILGLVSGAASVIFGLVMLDVGPSILYFLTRKGEPPRRPHPLMWALCGASGLTALVVPSVTGAAPSQVCSNIQIAAFECAPAGPDLQGEYVELINRGNTDESLNGWSLCDQ